MYLKIILETVSKANTGYSWEAEWSSRGLSPACRFYIRLIWTKKTGSTTLRSWLSPGKATQICKGKNTVWNNQVRKTTEVLITITTVVILILMFNIKPTVFILAGIVVSNITEMQNISINFIHWVFSWTNSKSDVCVPSLGCTVRNSGVLSLELHVPGKVHCA